MDSRDLLTEWPDDAPTCDLVCETTQVIIDRLAAAELCPLAIHNPALDGFSWKDYLCASRFRIMWLIKTLRARDIEHGRILDQGSFFGNFSLALSELGYNVVACDYYREANGAMDSWRELLAERGVETVDAGQISNPLPFDNGAFDVVISMSVIEHISSSPREHLLELARCLRTDGLMVVETPNLAYQYKRDLLAEGKSVMAPIESQFEAAFPFSGHHREYIAEEVEWMLGRVGIETLSTSYLDYSYRSLPTLDDTTREQAEFRRLKPSRQELLMVSGRKTTDVVE